MDENQSAFLPGRRITDNIIIGYECMHTIRSRRGKANGFAALKLDMSKAYDRLEWSYIELVMKQLGFPGRFAKLIMKCITTVTYSFLLNGQVCGKVKPQRGVRQGDLLSPLLFVMCAQGLSGLLHEESKRGLIKGVNFGRSGTRVSHLLFADDSLLFFRAHTTECVEVKRVLEEYEVASGQYINFDKSAITFSPAVKIELAQQIRNILQVRMVEGHALYLGLPTYSMRQNQSSSNILEIEFVNGLVHGRISCYRRVERKS